MCAPIFEPEFSFLPFGCSSCGARFQRQADLDLHRRETCSRTPQKLGPWNFEIPNGGGIADGGRKA
jgi:hypothetical protein